MQPFWQNGNSRKSIFEQLDKHAKALNTFLFVLAIGLAVLDVTCFVALRLSASYSSLQSMDAGYSTKATAPK